MKKILVIIASLLFFLPGLASAQEGLLTVSPTIIDERVMPGDILKYDIVIKNDTEFKASIYAMVNDMLKEVGEQEFSSPGELDGTTSLARWISFKRGVIDIPSGEEAVVPLEINISSQALPGKRFARLALPVGSNRPDAQERMLTNSFPQILINIEVAENIIEKTQLKEFGITKKLFVEPPATFSLGLNNFGNRPVEPVGNIYIYNRRGQEVASLNVNPERQKIAPEEVWENIIDWPEMKQAGKYKAKLEISYGEKNLRDLQDALYFWYFPWKMLILIFLITFILMAVIVRYIFKKTYHHHAPIKAKIQVQSSGERSEKLVNLKK